MERQLFEVKKKGRPISQCPTCRLLRKTRKMHNKCECDKIQSPPDYTSSSPPSPIQPSPMHQPSYTPSDGQPYMNDFQKTQMPSTAVRSIIPKSNTLQQSMLHHFATVVTASLELSDKDYGDIPLRNVDTAESRKSSCCSKTKAEVKNENAGQDCCGSHHASSDNKHGTVLEPCCTNNRPCASSRHKGSEKKSRIVLVTCRCGDDCACPGCDVHPSKVMKGKKDPYAGYTSTSIIGEATVVHRKPSIDDSADEEWKSPSAVFNEHGVMLCGCGCDRPFDSCRGCGHGME
ncbi:copper-binding transcription factor [Umbelopsis sp. WA50703]